MQNWVTNLLGNCLTMNDEEIQLLTDFLSGASTGSELYDSVPQGVFKSFFPVKYQEHPQVRKLYFQFRKQRQDLKERVNKNIQKEYGGIIVRTEDTFNENENEINYSEHLFAQLCELNEQLNEAIDETQSECISIENKINLFVFIKIITMQIH